MKIKRFLAQAVHGHLNFDVPFDPALTFLTGINGTGKTTVVRGIASLISPSLMRLASTAFTEMTVELEHEGEDITIAAVREGERLLLKSNKADVDLEIKVLEFDPDDVPLRVEEGHVNYYQQQEAANSEHPVMQVVQSLPTPMFLGIERRATTFPRTHEEQRYYTYSVRRRARNVFGSTMFNSLMEAAALAERRYHTVQRQQRELTDQLRRALILSALEYDPKPAALVIPQWFTEQRRLQRIKETLQSVGLDEIEITQRFDPVEQKLSEILEHLGKPGTKIDPDEILSGEDTKKAAALFEWLNFQPQVQHLDRIKTYVDRYVAESEQASSPIDRYLDIVNRFLGDSGKNLEFDPTGILVARSGDSAGAPVTSLSSGESQVVVILTHLAFNPAAARANVFMIDEPELSLHLRWQEMFVDAVQEVNPNVQVILATHSPAVILERIENCIDLGEANQ